MQHNASPWRTTAPALRDAPIRLGRTSDSPTSGMDCRHNIDQATAHPVCLTPASPAGDVRQYDCASYKYNTT
jgi:hypothetical protein